MKKLFCDICGLAAMQIIPRWTTSKNIDNKCLTLTLKFCGIFYAAVLENMNCISQHYLDFVKMFIVSREDYSLYVVTLSAG